jgi:hypothetical protein
LTGAGTLTASSLRTTYGVASLSGQGTATASGHKLVYSTAALTGSGTLHAFGTRVVTGSADLFGFGHLIANAGDPLGPTQPAGALDHEFGGYLEDDDGGGLIARGTTGRLSRV